MISFQEELEIMQEIFSRPEKNWDHLGKSTYITLNNTYLLQKIVYILYIRYFLLILSRMQLYTFIHPCIFEYAKNISACKAWKKPGILVVGMQRFFDLTGIFILNIQDVEVCRVLFWTQWILSDLAGNSERKVWTFRKLWGFIQACFRLLTKSRLFLGYFLGLFMRIIQNSFVKKRWRILSNINVSLN